MPTAVPEELGGLPGLAPSCVCVHLGFLDGAAQGCQADLPFRPGKGLGVSRWELIASVKC